MKQISMIITLSIEMPLEIRELKTAVVFFFFLTVCYIHICHSLLLTLTSVILFITVQNIVFPVTIIVADSPVSWGRLHTVPLEKQRDMLISNTDLQTPVT